MDRNVIADKVWKLADELCKVSYAYDVAPKVVRLVFLKYASDNFLGAENSTEYQYYAKVQKIFAMKDIDGGPNSLYPILTMIDEYYSTRDLIRNTIPYFAEDLFGLDAKWAPKTATRDAYKRLVGILAEMDFSENDDKTVGKMLVETLTDFLYKAAGTSGKMRAANITNLALTELAQKILNVQENEVFADLAAGYGVSTRTIVKDNKTPIIHSEINRDAAAIAAMMYIMAGYRYVDIILQDSIIGSLPEKANKIFVDPPIGLKLTKTPEMRSNDSSMVFLDKIIESLADGGRAVMTIGSSMLFKSDGPNMLPRKDLVDKGYLEAVIALPPMWYGTVVSTNLLVISKKKNDHVYMMNASRNNYFPFLGKGKDVTLSQDGVAKIVDLFNDGVEPIGIAATATTDDIRKNGYDLSPHKYIEEQTVETESLETINAQLAELYDRLAKLK